MTRVARSDSSRILLLSYSFVISGLSAIGYEPEELVALMIAALFSFVGNEVVRWLRWLEEKYQTVLPPKMDSS